MIERFQYDGSKMYPGKASVIFWTNGSEMRLGDDGNPTMSADPDASPYYLEAELNSPMCRLRPGEACTMDTEWFPTRAGTEFHGVAESGILIRPLTATAKPDGKVGLIGTFGVFYSGELVARFYNEHGHLAGVTPVIQVSPNELVSIHTDIAPPGKCSRLSIHLIDDRGIDRGALQEIPINGQETH